MVYKKFVTIAARAWMRLFGCVVPRSCEIAGFPVIGKVEGVLVLGEHVRVISMPTRYARGMPCPCTFSAEPGAIIEIGDDSYVAGAVLCAGKRISIGKRVLIAAGCKIFDSDGHVVDAVPHSLNVRDEPEEILIEDDVWLGSDVLVCKGVTIGKGSVIGAKSVVTRDIPPGVLAAGAPARVIRPLRLEDKT